MVTESPPELVPIQGTFNESSMGRPERSTEPTRPAFRWKPRRVMVTRDAAKEPHGRRMIQRLESMNLPIEFLKQNRIAGLRGKTDSETYRNAKDRKSVV